MGYRAHSLHSVSPQQSFSELFVSFLEHESETLQGISASGANGASSTNPLLTGLTPRSSVQSERAPLATSTPLRSPVSVASTTAVGSPVGSSVSPPPVVTSSSQAHAVPTDASGVTPIRWGHSQWGLTLSLPRVINFKFPLQPHQEM